MRQTSRRGFVRLEILQQLLGERHVEFRILLDSEPAITMATSREVGGFCELSQFDIQDLEEFVYLGVKCF